MKWFKKQESNNEVVNNNRRTIMTGREDTHMPPGGEDWSPTEQYGKNAIDGLKSKAAVEGLGRLGSTPTPFNRIELTQTAFEYVANKWRNEGRQDEKALIGLLDEETTYHALISECFDIGELFFHFQSHNDRLKIIEWNRSEAQKRLRSAQGQHKYFGAALELFFNSRAEVEGAPNKMQLADIERIYLLNYQMVDNGVGGMRILGGTSPYTLFFAADIDKAQTNFIRGERVLFRNTVPLYRRRNTAYLKFWFTLRVCWEALAEDQFSFAERFPALDTYLDMTYEALSLTNPAFVQTLDRNTLEGYWTQTLRPIFVNEEVIQRLFRDKNFVLKQAEETNILATSSFKIEAEKDNGKQFLPLVLPIDNKRNYNDWIYIDCQFNEEIPVPSEEREALDNRCLPSTNIRYPYLTESDLFYGKLLVCDLPPSPDYFFGIGYNGKNISVLPPVKPLYFDYFSIDALRKNLKITVENENAEHSRVIVELQIPARGGNVVYRRIYNGGGNNNREFPIVLRHFVVGIYPFIHIPTAVTPLANYRVLLANLDQECRLGQSARFFPEHEQGTNGDTRLMQISRNTNQNSRELQTTIYKVPNVFDYIELIFDDDRLPAQGIVVPQWSTVIPEQDHLFSFAVDFGTSNTHIEGAEKDGIGNVRVLDNILTGSEFQMAFKVNLAGESELRKVLRSDYFPQGMGTNYKFPIQTVLNRGQNTAWNEETVYLAQTNVPYCYGEYRLCEYDRPLTNLKWQQDDNARWQIKSYLSCLLYQLRNYVLLANGNLSATRIIRFFPASMSGSLRDLMDDIWQEIYRAFFNAEPQDKLFSMMESLAPFYYHCEQENTNGRFLCIDIGGETTDIVFARQRGEYKFVSSFRFASGALYGDGYNRNIEHNGFVTKFAETVRVRIEEKLKEEIPGMSHELKIVYDDIKQSGRSMDLINFFFSLKARTNNNIDFARILSEKENDAIKAVYVIYFAAIMYHLAQMLEAEKQETQERYIPNHIAFTGNGAKAFEILDSSIERGKLSFFAKCIFEYVLKEKAQSDDVSIILRANPKETLCKGGLLHMQNVDARHASRVLLGDSELTVLEKRKTYQEIQGDESLLNSVLDNVDDFYAMLLKNMDNNNFSYEDFGVQCGTTLVEQLTLERNRREQQRINLLAAIAERGTDREIRETLFFFPIKGSLSEIAERIALNNRS